MNAVMVATLSLSFVLSVLIVSYEVSFTPVSNTHVSVKFPANVKS